MRTDSIRTDNHSLDYEVGIALKKASIHKRTRIALVGVTDYPFRVSLYFAARFPFPTGWKSSAAAASEPGIFNFFNNFFRA